MSTQTRSLRLTNNLETTPRELSKGVLCRTVSVQSSTVEIQSGTLVQEERTSFVLLSSPEIRAHRPSVQTPEVLGADSWTPTTAPTRHW